MLKCPACVAFRLAAGRWAGSVLVVGTALAVGGCGTTANPGLNTQLPALQQSVDDLLAADDIAAAEGIARGLERRLPGIDTYAILGRVLWRAGDLVHAEALFRRSAVGGAPEGLLGMARSHMARGDLAAAAGIADELTSAPQVAARALRLMAAAAWAEGRTADAAEALAAAAEAVENPQRERDRAEAELLQQVAAAGDAPHWIGGGAVLELRAADMTIPVRLDGRPARMQLSLMERRSAIAVRAGADTTGDVAAVALDLGGIAFPAAVVEVRSLPQGIDGVLAFDLLSRLHWALDVQSGVLEIAAVSTRAGGDGPRPLRLARTYWASVRIPREGLAAQLLLVPRVRGRVLTAALDPGGDNRLDGRALPGPTLRPGDGPLEAEVRLGAWREVLSWAISDLYREGRDGAVAPEAILGGSALRGWRLYWTPGDRSLALERVAKP